ncbi:MAG: hypothetical protein Q9213_006611 [Squamulea squamosa]
MTSSFEELVNAGDIAECELQIYDQSAAARIRQERNDGFEYRIDDVDFTFRRMLGWAVSRAWRMGDPSSSGPLKFALPSREGLVRRIPFGSGTFTRFNWRGWEIWDRYRAHQEYGDAIFFVTPGKNYLQLCDAEAVSDILRRPIDFPHPPESTEMLNIFGPNVGTVVGTQWQRHRKITASSFNEHVNQRVWTQSILQSTDLIKYWALKSSIDSVAADTRTVSLHVMSAAVFGKSYPFRGADEKSNTTTKEDSSSYGEALRIILDRCIPLVVLGRKNLSKPWLPRKMRELYDATLVFQRHMTEAYESTKQAMARNEKLENNLMTFLVRASLANVDQKGGGTPAVHQEGLTEEEVYGNVFVFNFAGHDATANSLAIGICLLATRPDVQDWIAEEINAFEAVRLYTAVAIAKTTGTSPQPLKIGVNNVLIPANTTIIPNYSAMHTHPRYWGCNSLDFEPSRWITQAPPSTTSKGPHALERHPVEIFKEPPARNSPFVGWSGGARSCPGRKFSQVEFVGVLVGLFREFKVKPVLLKGENDSMARERLLEQIRMDTGMKLLLQMLHPERAVLHWRRR